MSEISRYFIVFTTFILFMSVGIAKWFIMETKINKLKTTGIHVTAYNTKHYMLHGSPDEKGALGQDSVVAYYKYTITNNNHSKSYKVKLHFTGSDYPYSLDVYYDPKNPKIRIFYYTIGKSKYSTDSNSPYIFGVFALALSSAILMYMLLSTL